MSVYAIAQSTISDPEQFGQYLAAAGPTLEAYQARLLALDENATAIEGEAEHLRVVILEFESAAHFRRWYDSPEYRAAREHRLPAAAGTFILVEGLQGA